MKDNKTSEPVIGTSNCFQRTLGDHRKGNVFVDLSESLQECVEAVMELGKPATLTLKLKLTPNGESVALTDEITTKLPKATPKASIFFATEDHLLQRDNPNQQEMDLKTVPTVVEEPLRKVAVAS